MADPFEPEIRVMNRREQERRVQEFNAQHPIGTPVRYWTGVRGDGPGRCSRTRTAAQLLQGHTAVVWMQGEGSCVALTHVEPLDAATAALEFGTFDPCYLGI